VPFGFNLVESPRKIKHRTAHLNGLANPSLNLILVRTLYVLERTVLHNMRNALCEVPILSLPMLYSSSRLKIRPLVIGTALSCTLSVGQVFAQQLPPPAPQPDTTTRKPKTPASTPPQNKGNSTPDIIILPAPATGETLDTAPYQAPDQTPNTTPETTPPNTTPQPPDDSGTIIQVDPTPRPTPSHKPPQRSAASVGAVSVAGLNDVAALRKLGQALAPKLSAKVTLFDGQRKYVLTRDGLGAKIPMLKLLREAQRSRGNVPVRFTVDLNQAERALRRLAPDINRKAQPISLDLEDGKVVTRGGDGVTLAITGSAQRVKQALEAQPPRTTVDLVVARTLGKGSVSDSDLSQMHYLLASFSTPYDASIRGRTHNLRIAARNVNGTIVPDGEVFSANRAIGKRDAAAGWQEAKMFVSGQVVSGVGAGICQCASTLYNAALLAGLPIVERHPHMFRVSYAPPSRDATLYWGSKDFRFRNNTGGPIYVQTLVRDGRFYARLYGTQPVREKISVESRTLSHKNGTRSVAYRVMESDTGTQRELLSRDYYMPHP